jgi:hypothetical protein
VAEFRLQDREEAAQDVPPKREQPEQVRDAAAEVAEKLVHDVLSAYESGGAEAARARFQRLTTRERSAVVAVLARTHGNGWVSDVLASEEERFRAREAAMREKSDGMSGYQRALARHRGETVEPSRDEIVAALEARDAAVTPAPSGRPLFETEEAAPTPVEEAHDPDPIASGPSAESTFRERSAALEEKTKSLTFLERALARHKRKP